MSAPPRITCVWCGITSSGITCGYDSCEAAEDAYQDRLAGHPSLTDAGRNEDIDG